MIQKITIQNFRCFKKLAATDLTRFNVLVGRNGSGKTAFLEALFIGNGSLEPLLRIRNQRLGQELVLLNSDERGAIEPLVHQLFHQFNTKNQIQITTFGPRANTSAKLTTNDNTLRYEFQPRQSSKFQTTTMRIGNDGELKIPPPPPNLKKVSFYPASIKHNPREVSQRFSELSKRTESEKFITGLKPVLPDLEDLSIELESGTPMVFAKMKGLDERIPMQYVSDGIYRLLSILMGISSASDGYVLIDELENGIYHRNFPEIVELIYNFSITFDVQIFVTTHSKELLQAIADVSRNHEAEYCLQRIEKGENEQFNGITFRSAIEQEIEIR